MADCSLHSVPTHLTHGPNNREVITESTESGETVDWLKPVACLKKGWSPEMVTYVELSFVTGIIKCIYFFICLDLKKGNWFNNPYVLNILV